MSLDGRNGTTIDYIFAACDRRGARRDEERDQISNLIGLGGSTDRDAAQRVHQALPRRWFIAAGFNRKAGDERSRSARLDPTGRNTHDADSLRAHLLDRALL